MSNCSICGKGHLARGARPWNHCNKCDTDYCGHHQHEYDTHICDDVLAEKAEQEKRADENHRKMRAKKILEKAAPDMLEALKAMTFYLTDPVPATREKSDAVYYKCVRAIAKAEGRK